MSIMRVTLGMVRKSYRVLAETSEDNQVVPVFGSERNYGGELRREHISIDLELRDHSSDSAFITIFPDRAQSTTNGLFAKIEAGAYCREIESREDDLLNVCDSRDHAKLIVLHVDM